MRENSPFIFVGTVEAVASNNLPGIPADPNDALVRVQHVSVAPSILGDLTGRVLTVRLTRPAKVGESATFLANSWVYGAEIGVFETRRTAGEQLSDVGRPAINARLAKWDTAVRARLEAANVVVTGQVSEVKDAGVVERGEGTHWSRATTEVWRVLRGRADATVEILFPTIGSPRYRTAPRFVQGQSGLWVLQTAARDPWAAELHRTDAYTAIDELDFHAVSAVLRVEALLALSTGR